MPLIPKDERTDGPMIEEHLAELERLVQEATTGPWEVSPRADNYIYGPRQVVARIYDDANGKLIAASPTVLPELIAEVRRLRECLETVAHMTSFSGDHPNSHVWAYIMGEALQADPQESPFWQSDEVRP